MPKENVNQSISFPDPTLLDYAKDQARLEDRTLSKWVCRLIEAHRDEQARLNDPHRKTTYGKGVSSKRRTAIGRLVGGAGKPADPAP